MIPPEDVSDSELATQSLRDPERFAFLVERYSAKLFRYVGRVTRLPIDHLEDIVQDIFLKAYRGLASYNPQLPFSSWIYRIAHNESISFLRKHKHNLHVASLDIDDRIVAHLADVQQDAIDTFTKKKVNDALAQLPEKYAAVLVLYFFEDKDYESISDILKVPAGTVATRLRRGKQKLNQLLSEYSSDL